MYSSPNIIRVKKSRRMRWTGHIEVLGRGQVHTEVAWGDIRVRYHLEDIGRDGDNIEIDIQHV
jgi:hypothetical protein